MNPQHSPVYMPNLPKPPHNPDDADTIADWRKQVRKALLAARTDMPGDMRVPAVAVICQLLKDVLASADLPAKARVGFYWPVQGEIDVTNVIGAHIAKGGQAALPVVTARHQPMVFHRWTPDTSMVTGFANIAIPATQADQEPVVPDVILAPLVGFDQQGYRLGYGGGFFDRTLEALGFKPVVIGIGFAHARLNTIFPHQYDVPMDILITEQGIEYFGR
ncbi:5-formyltetrahydrofolate cyclo-ligase [Thalassospira marina]|uniref:5-formyltetrahydrofolate cyclo-ligase n=1 Tax=Thalassospira marina TaxID=2048283 RepID=A0A2N3L083_9PROT|nr:5-formyltetrahydrofolate cyclo-ligase [Thalassospira marina]PKR56130.1 5-formyltetrahydrofolate cyclo-ligase [Thalassospira marina]